MALVEMTEALKVGYFAIDEQHKEIFEIINELHEGVILKRKKGDIDMAFTFLDSYVKAHFAMEESLMSKRYYPAYDEHKEKHAYFLTTLDKIKKSFNEHDGDEMWSDLKELELLLKDWFIDHIVNVDKKVGDFLSSKVA